MGIKHSWPGVAKFKIAATLWSLGLVLCVVVLAALLAASFTAFAAASPTPGFDKYEGLSGQAPTFVGTKGFAPVPGVKSPSETMETALAPASVVRYEQGSPAVDLSGSWWTLAHSSASGGSYARCSGEFSVATFSFTGTYVALVATKGPTMGRAIVSVDGGAESTVNLNSSAVGYQWTVWSASGLASGEHEVTVWWDMTNTEGTYINIDAFDVSMSGTGSISGKVTNSSGTALPDVAVLAIDADGEAIGGALTGTNGTYSITGLSNQSVKVVTLNDLGYIDEWYSNVVAPGNWDGVGATALNLASTPTRTGINFSLAVGKTISGRVTYESLPVEGMEVEAYDEDLNWCASGRADANGHYDITGLPAGRYLVATYDEAGWWIDEWYDNDLVPLDPDGDSATLIDVRTSNAVNKDFALERPATIWGRVTSSTGTGLADIQIRVQLVGEDFTAYAWTNAQGDYFLGGLPNGDYVVNTANDQGYVDEWYDNDPAPGDIFGENVTPIHLSGGWMVDFSLDRGYSISGAVTDNTNGQPPTDPGMVVNVFDASGKWCAFNFVDAESAGFYTTWALPAGTYYAEASDSWGYGPLSGLLLC